MNIEDVNKKADKILAVLTDEGMDDSDYGWLFSQLLVNCVNYVENYNNSISNWKAREMFRDILTESQMKELFDENA